MRRCDYSDVLDVGRGSIGPDDRSVRPFRPDLSDGTLGLMTSGDFDRDGSVDAAAWDPTLVAVDWPTPEASRAIARRRQRLYEAARELEAIAATASGWTGWSAAVERALDDLRGALVSHAEETEGPGGLFEDVADSAPRLVYMVDDMKRDHVALLEDCDRALGAVRDGADQVRVRRRVNVLLGRLAEHRQQGAEMLYEAFMTDIGSGD